MKYLRIDQGKALYWDGKEYQEIDRINREDLLALLNAAEAEDFELDTYDEELLGNKAHQVIYANIYEKFENFLNDKAHFKAEVEKLYEEAIGKYSADTQNESLDEFDGSETGEGDEAEIDPDDLPF